MKTTTKNNLNQSRQFRKSTSNIPTWTIKKPLQEHYNLNHAKGPESTRTTETTQQTKSLWTPPKSSFHNRNHMNNFKQLKTKPLETSEATTWRCEITWRNLKQPEQRRRPGTILQQPATTECFKFVLSVLRCCKMLQMVSMVFDLLKLFSVVYACIMLFLLFRLFQNVWCGLGCLFVELVYIFVSPF